MRELPAGDAAATSVPVLVVASHFPASGGARVDKFVALLPRFGYRPSVVCAGETSTAASRELRKALYPGDLEVYEARSRGWSYFTERFIDRGPGAPKYRLLAALSFPERCLYVPDYMVRWISDGIRIAKRLVVEKHIPVVLTSSPPESTHLIGLALKHEFGIRWVADFRDLWTTKKLLYRPPTKAHDRRIRRLERQILGEADHIIANTRENLAFYQEAFKVPPERLSLIPNGFDREDLAGPPLEKDPTVFQIGYLGNLSKHGFPWELFIEAFKRLADAVGRERVRFVHCGYCSTEVGDYLRGLGIENLAQACGQRSHHEAMRIIAATDLRLALLYENEYSSAIVPAKLYNYLIMDGPIVAIAPERGAVAQILAETRMGDVVAPGSSVDRLYRILRQHYDRWFRGEWPVRPNAERIAEYDRHRHVERLAQILSSQVSAPLSQTATYVG